MEASSSGGRERGRKARHETSDADVAFVPLLSQVVTESTAPTPAEHRSQRGANARDDFTLSFPRKERIGSGMVTSGPGTSTTSKKTILQAVQAPEMTATIPAGVAFLSFITKNEPSESSSSRHSRMKQDFYAEQDENHHPRKNTKWQKFLPPRGKSNLVTLHRHQRRERRREEKTLKQHRSSAAFCSPVVLVERSRPHATRTSSSAANGHKQKVEPLLKCLSRTRGRPLRVKKLLSCAGLAAALCSSTTYFYTATDAVVTGTAHIKPPPSTNPSSKKSLKSTSSPSTTTLASSSSASASSFAALTPASKAAQERGQGQETMKKMKVELHTTRNPVEDHLSGVSAAAKPRSDEEQPQLRELQGNADAAGHEETGTTAGAQLSSTSIADRSTKEAQAALAKKIKSGEPPVLASAVGKLEASVDEHEAAQQQAHKAVKSSSLVGDTTRTKSEDTTPSTSAEMKEAQSALVKKIKAGKPLQSSTSELTFSVEEEPGERGDNDKESGQEISDVVKSTTSSSWYDINNVKDAQSALARKIRTGEELKSTTNELHFNLEAKGSGTEARLLGKKVNAGSAVSTTHLYTCGGDVAGRVALPNAYAACQLNLCADAATGNHYFEVDPNYPAPIQGEFIGDVGKQFDFDDKGKSNLAYQDSVQMEDQSPEIQQAIVQNCCRRPEMNDGSVCPTTTTTTTTFACSHNDVVTLCSENECDGVETTGATFQPVYGISVMATAIDVCCQKPKNWEENKKCPTTTSTSTTTLKSCEDEDDVVGYPLEYCLINQCADKNGQSGMHEAHKTGSGKYTLNFKTEYFAPLSYANPLKVVSPDILLADGVNTNYVRDRDNVGISASASWTSDLKKVDSVSNGTANVLVSQLQEAIVDQCCYKPQNQYGWNIPGICPTTTSTTSTTTYSPPNGLVSVAETVPLKCSRPAQAVECFKNQCNFENSTWVKETKEISDVLSDEYNRVQVCCHSPNLGLARITTICPTTTLPPRTQTCNVKWDWWYEIDTSKYEIMESRTSFLQAGLDPVDVKNTKECESRCVSDSDCRGFRTTTVVRNDNGTSLPNSACEILSRVTGQMPRAKEQSGQTGSEGWKIFGDFSGGAATPTVLRYTAGSCDDPMEPTIPCLQTPVDNGNCDSDGTTTTAAPVTLLTSRTQLVTGNSHDQGGLLVGTITDPTHDSSSAKVATLNTKAAKRTGPGPREDDDEKMEAGLTRTSRAAAAGSGSSTNKQLTFNVQSGNMEKNKQEQLLGGTSPTARKVTFNVRKRASRKVAKASFSVKPGSSKTATFEVTPGRAVFNRLFHAFLKK
ncbi:unnamed protein product [Amoebophrya sp. A120]|nr:unnamed protein product [Amoebophrya sp. A120]|eukprot:GSA120T00012597001.1